MTLLYIDLDSDIDTVNIQFLQCRDRQKYCMVQEVQEIFWKRTGILTGLNHDQTNGNETGRDVGREVREIDEVSFIKEM